jgi:hypothetical protein
MCIWKTSTHRCDCKQFQAAGLTLFLHYCPLILKFLVSQPWEILRRWWYEVKMHPNASLGSCISTTDPSAMPSFAKHVPMHTPIMVKHHGRGLGKCISKDAFMSPDHMVLSTSYQCLPGAKMTLKTAVLGFALPQMLVSQKN